MADQRYDNVILNFDNGAMTVDDCDQCADRIVFVSHFSLAPIHCSNMSFQISKINVIALIVRKLQVDPSHLEDVIKNEPHQFSIFENMLSDQLVQQLKDQDLYVDTIDTLDTDLSEAIDHSSPDPFDDVSYNGETDKLVYESDDEDNGESDPDYVPELPAKRARRHIDDVPMARWFDFYRYWTRQDDYDKPVVISDEMTSMKDKRSPRSVRSQFGLAVGSDDKIRNLRNWAKRAAAGGFGSIRYAELGEN